MCLLNVEACGQHRSLDSAEYMQVRTWGSTTIGFRENLLEAD